MRRPNAIVSLLLALSFGSASHASIWPTAERRVERALSDPSAVVRRHAARSLGELPRGAARRLALFALADADADVRVAAVEAAVALAIPELGPRLVSWLTDPETKIRLAAAEALRARPSSAALPALARASSDTDPKVRGAVARALGESGSPEAVVPLLGRLDDGVPEVRGEVVVALGRLGDRRAVVPLLAKVEDSAGGVRRAVARALGRLGDPRAVSALVLVLRDTDPAVRVAALDAVGRLGDASVVSSIVAVLASAEGPVRAAAASALARLRTPAAIAALLSELGRDRGDPDAIVRALAQVGPAMLPALRACVESGTTPLAVDGCARALGEAGDESDALRLAGALERGTLGPLTALPLLAALGGQAAVPAVLEELASSEESVRRAALASLLVLLDPSHPDGRAVDPLLSALRSRKASLLERALIVRLLGRSGSPRVAPELARLAKDSTAPAVVLAAVTALGELGPGLAEALLLEKLADDAGAVRVAAALSLRRTASARALPLLLDRLEHAAEQDRGALGIALPGAAAKTRDPKLLARLGALLAAADGGERDALLEALAAMPDSASTVQTLARSADAADRRKVAEVSSAHPALRPTLVRLAHDPDPLVRQNATWSLGFVAESAELGELVRLLADPDARTAANAAVSLGRAAARLKTDAAPRLCPRLAEPRPLARASALSGLRLAARGCEASRVETLLASDPSPRVRAAAAQLLTSLPASTGATEALERCAADDESAEVALRCQARASTASPDTSPVLVFVVPTGGDAPLAGAPFALRFADGSERFGSADRRGAALELGAPSGALELRVPPAAGD